MRNKNEEWRIFQQNGSWEPKLPGEIRPISCVSLRLSAGKSTICPFICCHELANSIDSDKIQGAFKLLLMYCSSSLRSKFNKDKAPHWKKKQLLAELDFSYESLLYCQILPSQSQSSVVPGKKFTSNSKLMWCHISFHTQQPETDASGHSKPLQCCTTSPDFTSSILMLTFLHLCCLKAGFKRIPPATFEPISTGSKSVASCLPNCLGQETLKTLV